MKNPHEHNQVPIQELLNPRHSPELGFQSYEMLQGNTESRAAQMHAFLSDSIRNPELDYPRLNTTELQHGIDALNDILDVSQEQDSKALRDAVWDSASYRMAEMYWLMSVARLQKMATDPQDPSLDAIAKHTQELNEELYGVPEKHITQSVLSEIWSQIDGKTLHGTAETIKHELEHGSQVVIAYETIQIPGLKRSEAPRLDTIPPGFLGDLREQLYRDNADIVSLVDGFWETVILQRPESERVFTPEDMFELFTKTHALRDPHNTSGVQVVMDPHATALSWETPLMAVKIAGRRKNITDKETMLAKIFHEYVVHGGRAIEGSKTELPVLGSGLFTEAQPGESSDYLTFEEGLATACELAVHSSEHEWDFGMLDKYLAISLAYEGRDFRQVYETLWRARALMGMKQDGDIDQAGIVKAQKSAYLATLRVFRGTPSALSRRTQDGEHRILTFNKDLAYLKGKMLIIDFAKQYKDNPAMLQLAFKAKSDLLNSRQRSLSVQYAL